MSFKPIIALTMGDPAGVGPEVVINAVQNPRVQEACRSVIIGNHQVMKKAAKLVDQSFDYPLIKSIDDLSSLDTQAALLEQPPALDEGFTTGSVDPQCGSAALNYIECAIDLALEGQVHGITTAPINKAAISAAGSPFIGHTELLAERTSSIEVTMMLVTPGRGGAEQWLRVTHATTHIPLCEVPAALNVERILKTIQLTWDGLRILGIDNPKLALAALNPHASDDGLMGSEEVELLHPTVKRAEAEGYPIQGPIPADTVFLRAIQGEFDSVVTLYHDQGHIPIKTHGFERAVNITLGLPIIRTSVDHGTAFDIAWQGIANEASMVEAIMVASEMAKTKE